MCITTKNDIEQRNTPIQECFRQADSFACPMLHSSVGLLVKMLTTPPPPEEHKFKNGKIKNREIVQNDVSKGDRW